MNNIIQTIRHTARAATVLLLALLTAQTAGAQTNVSTVSGLETAFNDPTVSEINVTDNITGVGDFSLKHDLTINLNGHTISGDELHFNVDPGCSLTINGGGQDGSVGNIISGKSDGPAISNSGTVTLSHVNITTNYNYAIGGGGTLNIGNNVSFNGWTAAPFNTQYVYIIDVGNYNDNVVATVTVGGKTHYFENIGAALVYIAKYPDALVTPDLSADFSWSGDTYTIHTATGWGLFCDMLENGETFSGKTVKLADDITVTRMAGLEGHEFQGTFDGNKKTLTVSISSSDGNAAPFREIMGATIRNLKVSGTVSGHKHSAGLVGYARGADSSVENTIENCLVATDVSTIVDTDGDCYLGGIVGHGFNCKLTIRGCAFTGSLTSPHNYTGGLQGWSDGNTLILENDLFAASSVNAANVGFHPIAFHVNNATTTATVTNVYYTVAPTCTTASRIAAAGKQARAVTAGTDVTVAHAGVATHYATSGITAYKASGACGDSDPFTEGILYDEVLYAGSGDEVSLTLANSSGDAPAGYQYSGDYSASGGATLSGSTLTMDDEDVTVSFTPGDQLRSTGQAVPVSYIDADGQPASHNAIALDGTEGSLGQNNQETWYYVGTDITVKSRIYLTGDMNLILADGYTLDVKGIYIPQGSTLTIYAESDGETAGKIVSHPTGGAAIGGKSGYDNGNIVIYGGNIEAAGGVNCAGIGSADGRTGGTITIYGGTVTAKGGTGGAAIGGGRSCSGGTIDIYGGDITANGPTNSDTCENGAGIGGGDYGDGGNITIYGGTITTYSRDGAGIGGGDEGDGGTITINGGTITSNKVNQGQGARIGGGCDAAPGTITINGGTITTEGGSGAGIGGGKNNLAGGTVTINGGVISASGSYGIGAGEEGADVAITLGRTSADDCITASTYNGSVTIADGKSFHNGSEVLEPGTVAASDYESKLNGKTLIGVDVLQDDAANDVAALATRLGGKQTNIALSGRKLWKDGAWNTLVLPFTIADIEADGCPLNGATVRQLSEAYVTGTTLTLNFKNATTAIAAGVPYIVKWADGTEGEYTQDPVFQDVTIDAEPHNYDNQAGGDTNVRFIGTYDQKTVNTEDRSILFLGAANTLYYPSGHSTTTIGPFRAYFKIGPDDAPAANARQLTAFNLTFGDENETTGISDATTMPPGGSQPPVWRGASGYTLDGRKLQAQPTRKGLYIHGGKKVVIK